MFSFQNSWNYSDARPNETALKDLLSENSPDASSLYEFYSENEHRSRDDQYVRTPLDLWQFSVNDDSAIPDSPHSFHSHIRKNSFQRLTSDPDMKLSALSVSIPEKQYTHNPNAQEFTPSFYGYPNSPPLSPLSPVHSISPPKMQLVRLVHKSPKVEIPAIYSNFEMVCGHVVELSKNQQGCRMLQRLLDNRVHGAFTLIYGEILDYVCDLMSDPFGNYLCQKILEHCTNEQRVAILSRSSSELVNIALSIHGTRAVQKLVDLAILPVEYRMIVQALSIDIVTLILDLNGNHVIQRCLNRFSSNNNQFIYDSVASECVKVATHKHGCCVFQRCLNRATKSQRLQLALVIIENTLSLIQNAYGNYVVQYLLSVDDKALVAAVMNRMLGSIPFLAIQKFSSNVIEKCLAIANDEIRLAITYELCDHKILTKLIQDPYANYVIQKALIVATEQERLVLFKIIQPFIVQLKLSNDPAVKRICSKIVKKFPQLDS